MKEQIEYGILQHDHPDDERLNELVRIVVEVMTSKAETVRVNREDLPTAIVKSQFGRLNMFHFQYVLESLEQSATKAHNIRAVLITSLYNSVNTLGNYYGNLVRCHEMERVRGGGGQSSAG